jgi:P27 family predicted phage terminase small subunit
VATSGRKAKPVSQHKAEGTYRADRHGARAAQQAKAKPPTKLKPPAHLKGEARKMFVELVDRATAAGIELQGADSYVVEGAALAISRARAAGAALAEMKEPFYDSRYGKSMHPAVKLEKASWEAAYKALAMMGFSPTDRERLSGKGDDGDGEADIYEMRRPHVVDGGA